MKKLLVCLLASALLTGTVMITAEAATKQLAFVKGKTGTSVSGKVTGSEDMDYTLRASAGQTMIVDLKASKGAAFFNVLPPGSTGEAIFNGANDGNHFKGELPADGDYTIRVYLMGAAKDGGKPVNYTLKVSIPAAKDSGSAKAGSETAAAEKACLAAVAKETKVSSKKLSVIGAQASQAGVNVQIKVPDATAPWDCLSDKKGKVDHVNFTGSEGNL